MPNLLLALVLAAASNPLTPAARQEHANAAVEKMRGLVEKVARVVQQAKEEKDLVKLNCASEKLSQVQGLLRVAEQAGAELRASIAKKAEGRAEQVDQDAQEHAVARVDIAGRKVGQLYKDAQQCIGQLAFYTDEKTVLDVDQPADLPADPTNAAPPPAIISRPPPASGF